LSRLAGLGLAAVALFSIPIVSGAQTRATPSEALAFISPTEARFVFPLDPTKVYHWGRPAKGKSPGSPDYSWRVHWPERYIKAGWDPLDLSLVVRWKPGGPHRGSLGQLVAGETLDPMIEVSCPNCGPMVRQDPERDTTKVFVTVERGRLVFNIRGREAVSRIFPKIPDTVTFSRLYRGDSYDPDQWLPQTVLVNCRVPLSVRRNCIIKPVIPKQLPDADSAAAENSDRQVYVAVMRYHDVRLVPRTDVIIKRADRTIWRVMTTDSLGGVRLNRPPLGIIFLAARCPRPSADRTFGTMRVFVSPGLDTVVHMMTDPQLCSPAPR